MRSHHSDFDARKFQPVGDVLANNIFIAAQSDAVLKRSNVQGNEEAIEAHFAVGRKVQEFIINRPRNYPGRKKVSINWSRKSNIGSNIRGSSIFLNPLLKMIRNYRRDRNN